MDIKKLVALFRSNLQSRGSYWALVGLALFALSFPLALISTSFRSLHGWLSIIVVELLAWFILWLGAKLISPEQPPNWVWRLTVIAAVLRLAAGILWMWWLPLYGHNSLAEREGYVMGDAFTRDKLAWRMARSNEPLMSAFQDNRQADQYGGMLFLSAFIYRYLGSDFHQPVLMLLLAVAFSALAIPFTWAFTRLAWGPGEARLAAWLLALYPEAVLLGSSQMREAFTIPLLIAGLYGVLRYHFYPNRWTLLLMLGPLLVCLPFSPPTAALLLVAQLLIAEALRLSKPLSQKNKRTMWIVLAALVPLVLVGLYLAMRQFAPVRMNNPIEMLSWYLAKSARYQSYMTEHASGWIQKVFDSYSPAIRMPVLLVYGVMQPFLPAALIAGSESWVWYGIAVWRAAGWAVALMFMVYAPFLAGFKKDGRLFNLALCLILWLGILVASFRAGADQWDNPRYRAMFAALQMAVMAWTIVEHRRARDPWMRRAIVSFVLIVAWFIPWYLRRYTGFDWPVVDLFKTFGLGLASSFLFVLWDWVRMANHPHPLPAKAPVDEYIPHPPIS